MTHKECVEISYKWLLKNTSSGVAFKELVSIDREIPDVVGFDSWESFLIECKVSRSDFLRDKKKRVKFKNGIGKWRFYSCPKGLIRVDELPEKWGLIYIDEKGKPYVEYDCRKKLINEGDRQRIVRTEENAFEVDVIAERRIMYTALRRLFKKGYVKHIYEKF